MIPKPSPPFHSGADPRILGVAVKAFGFIPRQNQLLVGELGVPMRYRRFLELPAAVSCHTYQFRFRSMNVKHP